MTRYRLVSKELIKEPRRSSRRQRLLTGKRLERERQFRREKTGLNNVLRMSVTSIIYQ